MFGAAKPALGFRKCCSGKLWDFLILFNVVGNVVVPVELNKLRIPRGIQVLTWELFLKVFLLPSCWFGSPTADGRLQVD